LPTASHNAGSKTIVTESKSYKRGVRQLVGRLLSVSNFESSNVVVRKEAARRDLDLADRSWLNERLEEYRELLTYLHDH
jgi:hypothetical protein